MRVNAQLLEASSGTILWSKTMQLELKDIFEVQDQLARAIVESLSIPLSSGDQRRLRRDLPASARAYEFYLRGNQLAYDSSMLPVAGEMYRSALDEDPDFAPAWAKLGRVHRILAKYGAEGADEHLRKADEAFKRALEINPDLSVAHNLYTNFEIESLGRAKEAMVRLLGRMRSQAADPEFFAGLVIACRFCGLLDASLAADRHARRLDPTHPHERDVHALHARRLGTRHRRRRGRSSLDHELDAAAARPQRRSDRGLPAIIEQRTVPPLVRC